MFFYAPSFKEHFSTSISGRLTSAIAKNGFTLQSGIQDMSAMGQRAVGGLRDGDCFSILRTITTEDVECFAAVSNEYNPMHVDVEQSSSREYGGLTAHGLLTASLLNEVGGQIGWQATSMAFRFKSTVNVGDVLTCTWKIINIDEQGRALAEISIHNAQQSVVLEAKTTGTITKRQS